MQKRAWKDLESCQGEIVENFKRTLEEAGGNQLSRCFGAPASGARLGGVWSSAGLDQALCGDSWPHPSCEKSWRKPKGQILEEHWASLSFLTVCCHKKAWFFVSLTAPVLGVQHRLISCSACLQRGFMLLVLPVFWS